MGAAILLMKYCRICGSLFRAWMIRCSITAFSPLGFWLLASGSCTQVELLYLSMIFWASISAIGYGDCACCACGAWLTRNNTGTRPSTYERFFMGSPFAVCLESSVIPVVVEVGHLDLHRLRRNLNVSEVHVGEAGRQHVERRVHRDRAALIRRRDEGLGGLVRRGIDPERHRVPG